MDLEIGSNVFRDTDGIVEVEGVPQIEVVLKSSTGPLEVNIAFFDENGRITAKVVKSAFSHNELGSYTIFRTATSMTIQRTAKEQVVLQIDLKETGRVVISKGDFYTVKGHSMKISPVEWTVGKASSRGADTDAKGGPAVIG